MSKHKGHKEKYNKFCNIRTTYVAAAQNKEESDDDFYDRLQDLVDEACIGRDIVGISTAYADGNRTECRDDPMSCTVTILYREETMKKC